MEYKVGQVVICIDGDTFYNRHGAGWQKDLTFQIRQVSQSGSRTLLWPGIRGNGVFSEFVKHPTWKERYNNDRR